MNKLNRLTSVTTRLQDRGYKNTETLKNAVKVFQLPGVTLPEKYRIENGQVKTYGDDNCAHLKPVDWPEAEQTSLDPLEQNFQKQKLEMEIEFGKKRAKFKEMYLQKEVEELNKMKDETEKLKQDNLKIQNHLTPLQKELDEVKSLLTIAEYTKETEINAERRKCQEEVASLNIIIEGIKLICGKLKRVITMFMSNIMSVESVQEAKQNATSLCEKELANLKRLNEKLEAERHDTRSHSFAEKEGVLSAVTKSLKRSVGGLTANLEAACQTDNIENLEESMQKAQANAEMLRSLVVPLEKEIYALKEDLKSKEEKLKLYNESKNVTMFDSPNHLVNTVKTNQSQDAFGDLDEKVNNLSLDLEAEKSSRSDLEMYVGVLNAQKNVLQSENEKIQHELKEICIMLENEKRDHVGLKQTWQRANDQFLESQRLQIIEMRRMQSVLSEEQQRQIASIQKQEAEKQKQQEMEIGMLRLQELESDKLGPGERMSSTVKESPKKNKKAPKKLENRTASLRRKGHASRITDKRLQVVNDSFCADKALSESNLACHSSAEESSTLSPDNIKQKDFSTAGMRRAFSSSAVSLYKDLNESEFLERGNSDNGDLSMCADTHSLNEVDGLSVSFDATWNSTPRHALTEAQRKALTGVTLESEARKVMLESARSNLSVNEDILSSELSGKRLVSETEWHLLQQELKRATEKLGRPCDMCNNYETQLQRVQHEAKEKELQNKTVQQMLERYKDDLNKEQTFRQDLESKLLTLAEQAQKEAIWCSYNIYKVEIGIRVNVLYLQLEESKKAHEELKNFHTDCYSEIKSQMKILTAEREETQKELTRLQHENDSLTAKHSAQAYEMQNEVISLPNNLEDMQLLLLKYREEIIAAKVSKQHTEETLRSEIMFLRDSVKAEQTAKDRIEDQLMQEIDSLRENTGIAESIKSELEREKALRIEYEKSLKDSHSQIKQTQDKSRHTIIGLQKQFEETMATKTKLEREVSQFRNKVSSLQGDLENSEAVQRDFVKLSQNLQVQLEKIRQSEKEVRWQHEDDVEECSNCKQNFSVTRRKHHCRHCGKIFCSDCSSKIVYSGPHKKQSKVCDVCHTLLVPNIAPYFSNETPHTPD
ncbi:Rab GTPase-binding effector protein 1 [Nymphon striatum]|nr:Rab GTPase-binding effector protein 1 [Nymphon striatum]